MGGHRGYNICPWLKINKSEICGKSCREEYCKAHRAIIRKGGKIPHPCYICGNEQEARCHYAAAAGERE